MTSQKGHTQDVRPKLSNDMIARIEKICKDKGYSPDKERIRQHVDRAIDEYIEECYEISLEAIELQDGEADYATDELDDDELIHEAKLRVIKIMYEDRPQDLETNLARAIMKEIDGERVRS